MAECEHKNFHIYGYNLIGHGTCDDCHREFSLDVLLNILINRCQNVLKRMEEICEKNKV